jgi:Kazal-type serine protease inhibitor domain
MRAIEVKNCDAPCPRIMWPVCGSDGRIYLNECLLDKASCESETEVRLKTGGDCDPPVFKLLEKQNQLQKEKNVAAGVGYFISSLMTSGQSKIRCCSLILLASQIFAR